MLEKKLGINRANLDTIKRLEEQGFLSLSSFARYVGMAYSTAKRMVTRGELQTIKVGNVTRVNRDEIISFLKHNGNTQHLTEIDIERKKGHAKLQRRF